jgi:hypothetical protein
VLFWPQIKKQIAALQGGEQSNGQKHVPPCCCCPEEPHHDDADKSQWVVRTMETRAYCVDHRLEEGVELCEKLVGVLVASKPKVASVTVTKVAR